jgi:hypothetical protein
MEMNKLLNPFSITVSDVSKERARISNLLHLNFSYRETLIRYLIFFVMNLTKIAGLYIQLKGLNNTNIHCDFLASRSPKL